MTLKVFLSYAHSDRDFAEQLGTKMRALGAEVMADYMMQPGENWKDFLRGALEAADVVVYVAPKPGAAKANYAFFEAGAARAFGKRIIPVLPTRDPGRVGELPAGIRDLVVLDGSRLAPDALAESIVGTLNAA